MRADDIRALSTEEIKRKLEEAYQEHFNLRFQYTIKQLPNFNRLREVRRDIARLKTILREQELQALWEDEET
jgi:large subunit ribosomal protein L29